MDFSTRAYIRVSFFLKSAVSSSFVSPDLVFTAAFGFTVATAATGAFVFLAASPAAGAGAAGAGPAPRPKEDEKVVAMTRDQITDFIGTNSLASHDTASAHRASNRPTVTSAGENDYPARFL